jgi:hypothetical protein
MPQGVGTYGSQVGRPSKKASVEDMQDVRKKVSSKLKIRKDKDTDMVPFKGMITEGHYRGHATRAFNSKARRNVEEADEKQRQGVIKRIKRKADAITAGGIILGTMGLVHKINKNPKGKNR